LEKPIFTREFRQNTAKTPRNKGGAAHVKA
jgi:hypothetical protein